ncbi:MAG: nucleoside deaminase [Bacteroidales bacterium]|nr:nucleoside deaminase [Bacteroidales bacterium]
MSIEKFIERALELASDNVSSGGGPFGAVIVKNNVTIGEGVNLVLQTNDPTAHAEVVAIRNASKNVSSFDLSGSIIFCSSEPCPMCLSAIYWSKIDSIYFANDRSVAADAGFQDEFIYQEIVRPLALRQKSIIKINNSNAHSPFRMWNDKSDKMMY